MKEFNVTLSPAIQKDLGKLHKSTAHQILGEMQALKENPFPRGPRGNKIKKLATLESEYRLRVGDYRVVYRIEGSTVIALRVVDRKDFEKILRDLI